MTPPAADASKRISEAAPNQTTNAHHAHHRDVVEGCELSSSLGMRMPQLRATTGGRGAWTSMSASICDNTGGDLRSPGCDFSTTDPPNVPSSHRTRNSRVREQYLAAGTLQTQIVLIRPCRAVLHAVANDTPDVQPLGNFSQLPHLSRAVGGPPRARHGLANRNGPIPNGSRQCFCLWATPAVMVGGGRPARVAPLEGQRFILPASPANGAGGPSRFPAIGRGLRHGRRRRWCRGHRAVFLRGVSAPHSHGLAPARRGKLVLRA